LEKGIESNQNRLPLRLHLHHGSNLIKIKQNNKIIIIAPPLSGSQPNRLAAILAEEDEEEVKKMR